MAEQSDTDGGESGSEADDVPSERDGNDADSDAAVESDGGDPSTASDETATALSADDSDSNDGDEPAARTDGTPTTNSPAEPVPPEEEEDHDEPDEDEPAEDEDEPAEDEDEPAEDEDEPAEDEDEDEPAEDEDEDDEDGIQNSLADKWDPTGSKPYEDEEMPLTAHIEEMVHRLAIVCVVLASVTAIAFPFADAVINHLWYAVLPTADPRVYGPLEFLLTKIKVASLAGLVIALPVAVYQTYEFMRPGLYPHERRYYLASVPTSLVLALVGIGFAYFLILPAIFTYFQTYSEDAAEIAFGLAETFDLILIMMGWLAIVFQIPLLIMLAIMMGLTTREWLEGRRLYFWGGFLGISFIISPDPTGMAPLMVTATMIGLFEGTLALLRWTGR